MIFWLIAGCWISISSVVLVDMMGIDRVAHVVGLSWFAFSVGIFFGSPLTGIVESVEKCDERKVISVGINYRRV